MVKKGDTLVEVLLAVGIFSMVAIAVVAVMSGGTSNAQLALETTLAREEIDTQAEALRYVHDAYVAYHNTRTENGSDGAPAPVQIWWDITDNAIEPNDPSQRDEALEVLQYDSATLCGNVPAKAFVLNPRQLNDAEGGYVSASSSNAFTSAVTYPRLIFSAPGSSTGSDSASLLEDESKNLLGKDSVQGIYVVAVRDGGTTTAYDVYGTRNETTTAFYDFYIRTCWYASNAETPSSIATVVRLYNPDIVASLFPFTIAFYDDEDQLFKTDPVKTFSFTDDYFDQVPTRDGYRFDGWCSVKVNPGEQCTGTTYKKGDGFDPNPNAQSVEAYKLYAIWTSSAKDLTVQMIFNSSDLHHPITAAETKNQFSYTVYVNGTAVATNKTGSASFSQPVTVGDRVEVEFKGIDYYSLSLACSGTGLTSNSCSTTSNSSNNTYTITGTVGSNSISIKPVWSKGDYSMQQITNAQCKNLATYEDYGAKDARDNRNKHYKLRYINNHCWMAENLDYHAYTSILSGRVYLPYATLNASDSNVSKTTKFIWYNFVADQAIGLVFEKITDKRFDEQCDRGLSDGYEHACTTGAVSGTGRWYNYYAASAETVHGRDKSLTARDAATNNNLLDASSSICPKGWKLPSRADFRTVQSRSDTDSFSILGNDTGYFNSGSNDDGIVGFIRQTAIEILDGAYASWWTSEADITKVLAVQYSNKRYLVRYNHNTGSWDFSTSANRTHGHKIRCIHQ